MIKGDYQLVDSFSLMGKPFFLVVDFEKANWLIFPFEKINLQEVWFSFPDCKCFEHECINKSHPILAYDLLPHELLVEKMKLAQNELFYGNSYLLNFTCSVPLKGRIDLKELFHKANAPYKVLLHDEFLCFSPEKFIAIENEYIRTYPMKGTKFQKSSTDREELMNNPKEIAEHYTVVDLLRNDLGMVSEEIQVRQFRFITEVKKKNGTLLQVSSEIQGKLTKEYQGKIGSILNALLPAGSISGAPKKKTIEIIKKIEFHQRNFYTGIAAWFDGKNLDSCVLIRFIEKKQAGFFYKTGVGLTHLSELNKEIEEIYHKIYVPLD